MEMKPRKLLMRLAARNRDPQTNPRSHLSRKQREARRVSRILWALVALAAVAVGALLLSIAPPNKPLVTVYMPATCESCQRWMEHLEANGFRTELGPQAEWAAVRAKFGIPSRFQSSHTAVVDGLFVEGPVPAVDIHRALELRSSHHLKGLDVPGVPPGSPGSESPLPQPFTVLAVTEDGRLQRFAKHGH
jgi:hypothetical protein